MPDKCKTIVIKSCIQNYTNYGNRVEYTMSDSNNCEKNDIKICEKEKLISNDKK